MSPNASCNDITLLHAAIGVNSDLVALLIKRGASVNQKSRGTAPLVAAAAVGSRDDVRIVLKAGANPNTRAWQGNSILLAPIHNGDARFRIEKADDVAASFVPSPIFRRSPVDILRARVGAPTLDGLTPHVQVPAAAY